MFLNLEIFIENNSKKMLVENLQRTYPKWLVSKQNQAQPTGQHTRILSKKEKHLPIGLMEDLKTIQIVKIFW